MEDSKVIAYRFEQDLRGLGPVMHGVGRGNAPLAVSRLPLLQGPALASVLILLLHLHHKTCLLHRNIKYCVEEKTYRIRHIYKQTERGPEIKGRLHH